MLNITLSKSALYFRELDEKLYTEIKEVYPEIIATQRNSKPAYIIEGKPEELYNILFKLSYKYDIEIM